mgnify:CR=1 FL=1
MRISGRKLSETRNIILEKGYSKHADGSCLVKFGDTHVLCTASFEDRLPRWLLGKGHGWITAEYGMLPRSTNERMRRESSIGKPSGRTQEIQRLIGRSLRAAVDLNLMSEILITIDCDVIQADGGTRTASINGGFVALSDCIDLLKSKRILKNSPIIEQVAAVSCGIVNGEKLLDLDYSEDSNASVDANFVLTESDKLIEIQSTAENGAFLESEFLELLELAKKGTKEIFAEQKKIL